MPWTGLGAVDDEQPDPCRVKTAFDEVVEQGLDRGGVFGRPFSQAQRMLFAPPINADRGDQDQFVADVQAVDLRSPADRVSTRSLASHFRSFAFDRATNLRDTADFDVPSPGIDPTSPPGSRTEQQVPGRDLISIWFIAHWPSQSSSCAAAQLGSTNSCWPSPAANPRAVHPDPTP